MLKVAYDPVISVASGEVVVLPRNDPHLLGNPLDNAPIRADNLVQAVAAGQLARIVHGGVGETTRVVCGFLGCAQARNPALSLLPSAFKVALPDAVTTEWFRGSFQLAAEEQVFGRNRARMLLAKLTELLFLDAVQRYVDAQNDESCRWRDAAAEPGILQALAILHSDPRHRWTTEALARGVGMSRSAFAGRFAEVLGQPPMRYLAAFRLRLAAQRLVESKDSLAKIAFDIGYESEAAFNRAFKREHGLPPAAWRERHR
jgi:AraC-like DNA-binding protein